MLTHFPKKALAAAQDPMANHPIRDAVWTIEVFPGQMYNFTGTIQQAQAQAQHLNPHLDLSKSLAPRSKSLAPRAQSGFEDAECSTGRSDAIPEDLSKAIDKLMKIDVKTTIPPGSNTKVSCEYTSSIWVWNKVRETLARKKRTRARAMCRRLFLSLFKSLMLSAL